MVLPFAVIVHYAPVSQSGRGMDSRSFSCRFKSGQEYHFSKQVRNMGQVRKYTIGVRKDEFALENKERYTYGY